MKHSVLFSDADNHWDNALPLGNGVFGCMLFYEDSRLYMPMNHYEVYYNIAKNVLPDDLYAAGRDSDDPGAHHRIMRRRADLNQPPEGQPFCLYRTEREAVRSWGIQGFSGSYPPTGELIFSFADSLADAAHSLCLYVEDATCELTLENGNQHLALDAITAREDCILNHIRQSEPGLLRSITLSFPDYRDGEPSDITYTKADEHTVVYTVSRLLSGEKPFVFCGVITLVGAQVKALDVQGRNAVITPEGGTGFDIVTGIFTDWRYKNLPADALADNARFAAIADTLRASHKAYWREFFDRSSITLPDKFLEKTYTVNQYALDCCSGRDGIMKHHACGLNGLWAIRHPNLWGSMWYWDVNIQAAFAGVFSSNRLELARVFSDGLKGYEKLARRSAKNLHNLPGIASDYPYTFYYSCWSWCAQYLWFYYEYSLDRDYLRNEAWPLFLELCRFTAGIFEYDSARDEYVVYPDISPEQGPLAHNTVITVACAKYLFTFTLKAAEILDEDDPVLCDCRRILEKMPKYPVSGPSQYGIHLRDSEDAPDNLWIRHPSMLMPVFPIGEIDMDSNPETVQIIRNTLDYLEDNCEIGVFPGSWLAAAAARIGRGQYALRILYEKGIDHLSRSNGLSAEETDRFLNFCLIARQPLYYPCMMEFTGEMLAAVNEMLLQSHNGLIRIFPALPDGDPEYGRMIRHGHSYSERMDRLLPYEAWQDVRFDKLLAKGAFEVSAALTDGRLAFILVHSKKGGTVRITSPYLDAGTPVRCGTAILPSHFEDGILTFDTEAGKDYLIGTDPAAFTVKADGDYDTTVTERLSYTRRHIYIGEDSDTRYQKQLDSFLRDSFLGNMRRSNHTVYKFDFGMGGKKEYEPSIPLPVFCGESHLMRGMDFIRMGGDAFTPAIGYGFESDVPIRAVKRNGPDPLRCDFVEGEGEATFIIEAPRGQYELLVISGDTEEDSVTVAHTGNSRKIGGSVVKRGIFQSEVIPFVQDRDTPIRLHLSSAPGYKWKLNALILNCTRGY